MFVSFCFGNIKLDVNSSVLKKAMQCIFLLLFSLVAFQTTCQNTNNDNGHEDVNLQRELEELEHELEQELNPSVGYCDSNDPHCEFPIDTFNGTKAEFDLLIRLHPLIVSMKMTNHDEDETEWHLEYIVRSESHVGKQWESSLIIQKAEFDNKLFETATASVNEIERVFRVFLMCPFTVEPQVSHARKLIFSNEYNDVSWHTKSVVIDGNVVLRRMFDINNERMDYASIVYLFNHELSLFFKEINYFRDLLRDEEDTQLARSRPAQ